MFSSSSVAILQYLSTKCGVPEHWYPKDAKQRAKVMEYIQWHGNTVAAHNVFFQVVSNRKVPLWCLLQLSLGNPFDRVTSLKLPTHVQYISPGLE